MAGVDHLAPVEDIYGAGRPFALPSSELAVFMSPFFACVCLAGLFFTLIGPSFFYLDRARLRVTSFFFLAVVLECVGYSALACFDFFEQKQHLVFAISLIALNLGPSLLSMVMIEEHGRSTSEEEASIWTFMLKAEVLTKILLAVQTIALCCMALGFGDIGAFFSPTPIVSHHEALGRLEHHNRGVVSLCVAYATQFAALAFFAVPILAPLASKDSENRKAKALATLIGAINTLGMVRSAAKVQFFADVAAGNANLVSLGATFWIFDVVPSVSAFLLFLYGATQYQMQEETPSQFNGRGYKALRVSIPTEKDQSLVTLDVLTV